MYITAIYAHTQPKHTHHFIQCLIFPLTSLSFTPTFIVEVLPFLARLLFDGQPAVHHVDPPLHFHILLALLQGLDEKLPIISPDQTWLEKKKIVSWVPPYLFKGIAIPLEPVSKAHTIIWKEERHGGLTQVGLLKCSLRFIEWNQDLTQNEARVRSCFLIKHEKS